MSRRQPSHSQAEPSPRVFIGSSSAALTLAGKIGDELRKGGDIEAKVWDEGILQTGAILLSPIAHLGNCARFREI